MCVIELPLERGGSVLFEVEDLTTARKTMRGGGSESVTTRKPGTRRYGNGEMGRPIVRLGPLRAK